MSALALATFLRDNELNAAARSKVSALRALAESTQGLIGVAESACHIAAGIILCTLEVWPKQLLGMRLIDIDTRFSKMRRRLVIGCGMLVALLKSLKPPVWTRNL